MIAFKPISIGITNDGEESSVLSYQSYPGTDFQFDVGFDNGNLPDGWSTITNADCDNPGWFISEDASSSYFTIPPGEGITSLQMTMPAIVMVQMICFLPGLSNCLMQNKFIIPKVLFSRFQPESSCPDINR
ncbi:hypothetical protein Ct9H90mP29_03390 [bacterium]|nr:MAG: hypothetical protein Ct9H90mP29_03390 [bacterium]